MRRRALALRRGLTPEEREAAGRGVGARVAALPEFEACARLVLYSAAADEVPTRTIYEAALRTRKVLLWPRVLADGGIEVAACGALEGLLPDAVGIPAPPPTSPAERLEAGDLVIVPGVAFTARGARLGRGGGHYDRLLAVRHGELRVGLAFDVQVVPALPGDAHDQTVDLVVTPSGVWRGGQWRT